MFSEQAIDAVRGGKKTTVYARKEAEFNAEKEKALDVARRCLRRRRGRGRCVCVRNSRGCRSGGQHREAGELESADDLGDTPGREDADGESRYLGQQPDRLRLLLAALR